MINFDNFQRSNVTWRSAEQHLGRFAHLQCNALASAVVHKFAALQEWRQLNLIHCWLHSGCFQQLLQVADAKVGDTNTCQLALPHAKTSFVTISTSRRLLIYIDKAVGIPESQYSVVLFASIF